MNMGTNSPNDWVLRPALPALYNCQPVMSP